MATLSELFERGILFDVEFGGAVNPVAEVFNDGFLVPNFVWRTVRVIGEVINPLHLEVVEAVHGEAFEFVDEGRVILHIGLNGGPTRHITFKEEEKTR